MASLEVQSLLDIYPSLEYNNEKQKVNITNVIEQLEETILCDYN